MAQLEAREIGERIAQARNEAGLTQDELVDDIDLEEGSLLKAAIEHVLNGYGKLKAKGVKVDGGIPHDEQWRSEAEGETRTVAVQVDPETGALDPRELPKALDPPASEEREAE